MVFFNMFQSSNSQILGKTNVSTCFNMFSQCFNHILKSVGKPWRVFPGCSSDPLQRTLRSIRLGGTTTELHLGLLSGNPAFFPRKIPWGDFEFMVFVWGENDDEANFCGGKSIFMMYLLTWMVYFWENPIKTWMINSGYPYDLGHPDMNC